MSIIEETERYYAARAPVYDETAGYLDAEAEKLRGPIKARYQKLFKGKKVLEIACGSGYWTASVAETAKSILATDVNEALVEQAKERCKDLKNVQFQIADAYTLANVPQGFNAAFAVWWWSHMPLERIKDFLTSLHSKLKPGALVMFSDHLPYERGETRLDENGNRLENRTMQDGSSYEVVKNFPSDRDIFSVLSGIADNVQHVERPGEKSWSVTYNTMEL